MKIKTPEKTHTNGEYSFAREFYTPQHLERLEAVFNDGQDT